MEKAEQTVYVIDQLLNPLDAPLELAQFKRIDVKQLARRSELDLIIEKEETALKKELEPLKK